MEKKYRILFIMNQFFKGGAETALLYLFSALSPEKYEVDLLLYDQIDLENAISLVPEIPPYVRVIDVKKREKRYAPSRILRKLREKVTGEVVFRPAAVEHLRNNCYDTAIAYGEWFSCALAATEARARRKYMWIHADIDKADFLHPDTLRYASYFDGFLYASERSRLSAIERYPELGRNSVVIHNMVDREQLLRKSREPSPWSPPADGLPVVLTVANIRPEKNHLRQIEAMKLLWARGLRFHWVNGGAQADIAAITAVRAALTGTGLEPYFHLPGPIENPYPLMAQADAVCVLSDHESWSMVITEAKTLGVPVVATRTSGALEQIEDGKTGLLCDFSPEDIAEKLEILLTDPMRSASIRDNLAGFSPVADTLSALEPLLCNRRKKLLFVFDDINYKSGARAATLAHAETLSASMDVVLFSAEPAKGEDAELSPWRIWDLSGNVAFRSLSRSMREVWKDPELSRRIKLLRAAYAVLARAHLDGWLYHRLLKDTCRQVMENFDMVCVVSEASKLREEVARLSGPQKVQWIHTDYAAWRTQSEWTRAITKKDATLYQHFDRIVFLAQSLRDRFVALYLTLEEKTVVIPNRINYDTIMERAEEKSFWKVSSSCLNFITIGRMEREKRYDRLLKLAQELKTQQLPFHWYFVGSGTLEQEIAKQRDELGLTDVVTMTGALENPLPLLKQCDLFILLSDYEGTPVTIDECKVLGIPVLAADVGGIAEQLEVPRFGYIASKETINRINIIGKQRDSQFGLSEKECIAFNERIKCMLDKTFNSIA